MAERTEHEQHCYELGVDRGTVAASWVDYVDIAEVLKAAEEGDSDALQRMEQSYDTDFSGVDSAEEAARLIAAASEAHTRCYADFCNGTAPVLNTEDSDDGGNWDVYDSGVEEGIAAYCAEHFTDDGTGTAEDA
jgi:hypothetical protein